MSFKYDINGGKLTQKKGNVKNEGYQSTKYQEHKDQEATGFSQERDDENNSDIHDGEPKSGDVEEVNNHWIGRNSTQCVLRSLFTIIVGMALAAASFAPGFLPNEHIECLRDELFVQTQQINDYFATHESMKFAFLIFWGLCMDITMVVGFVVFAINGKTWRLPMTLALFYLTRGIIQKLFVIRFPEGYLWDYPGFPSLVVPYGKTNDFFYSGHVGGALVMMLEYRQSAIEIPNHKMFLRGMQIFSFFTIISQIFLMIFLRGHYTIDMFTGIVVGHYYFINMAHYAPYVDSLLWRMGKRRHKQVPTSDTMKSGDYIDQINEGSPEKMT
jgi:hypothetical protein